MKRSASVLLLAILLIGIKTVHPQCSGVTLTLTAAVDSKADITSPYYPSNYENNAACQWEVTSPAGTYIFLYVYVISIESGYDVIKTFDASGVGGSVLQLISNSYIGRAVVSTGNVMTVQFTSDSSVTRRGFKLHYFAVYLNTNPLYNGILSGSTCGTSTTISGSISQIATDQFPSRTSGSYCNVTITGLSNPKVTVVWSDDSFTQSSPCSNGGLDIYDGSSSTLLYSVCSNSILGGSSQSVYPGQAMIELHYTSVAGYPYYGPVITIEDLGAPATSASPPTEASTVSASSCSGSFTASNTNASIYSPNYPATYSNDQTCSYTITTPMSSELIVFVITSLSTERNYDAVRVWDGPSDSYSLIGTYSGVLTYEPSLTSSGQSLHVRFTSDGSVVNSGYVLSYSTVNQSLPSCASSYNVSTVTSTTASFDSHAGYSLGSSYSNNYNEYWLLDKVDETVTMTFYFTSFRLESSTSCVYDYLRVYAGTCDTDTRIYNLCGADSEYREFTNGRYLLFHFGTDSSVVYGGFRLNYYIGSAPSESNAAQSALSSTTKILEIVASVVPVIILIAIVSLVCCCKLRARVAAAEKPLDKPLSNVVSKHNLVIMPKIKQKIEKPKVERKKKIPAIDSNISRVNIDPAPPGPQVLNNAIFVPMAPQGIVGPPAVPPQTHMIINNNINPHPQPRGVQPPPTCNTPELGDPVHPPTDPAYPPMDPSHPPANITDGFVEPDNTSSIPPPFKYIPPSEQL